jgi:ribosomal protein S3
MRKLSTSLTDILKLTKDLQTDIETLPKNIVIKLKINELKRRISLARLDSRHIEDTITAGHHFKNNCHEKN